MGDESTIGGGSSGVEPFLSGSKTNRWRDRMTVEKRKACDAPMGLEIVASRRIMDVKPPIDPSRDAWGSGAAMSLMAALTS
ncbi:hypothetical protein [Singulisphaera sp. PoT]|uniref:hypothetical protein n=1 Tax=Singulisphaera sp. PoT TaxID=3411797 RepID=UPI003BF53D57